MTIKERRAKAKPAYEALMKYYPFTLDDLPGEQWKTVPDYEDYQGSNFGRVKSFKQGKARIMKPVFVNEGYLQIMLCKDGKSKWIRVHQLVALCFIPNPEGKPQVNHRDGFKLNNHVSNLEWVTASENTKHAHDKGLATSGEDCYKAKLTNEQVRYVRDNPDGLDIAQLAERFGVSDGTIGDILTQRAKKIKDAVREQIRAEHKYDVRGFGQEALAKKYGLSSSMVWLILHEKS